MLSIVSKIIAAILVTFSLFVVSKSVLNNKDKLFTLKNILTISIFPLSMVLTFNIDYYPLYPLMMFSILIIVHKIVFKTSLSKTIITVTIVYILYFVADIIVWIIMSSLFGATQVRSNGYIFIVSNVLVSSLAIAISFIPFIRGKLSLFISKIEKIKNHDKILFFIFAFLGIALISYNISISSVLSFEYLVNVIIMFFFFVLAFIYMNEKLKRDKLNDEYDRLFEYVDNFENWIEDEQLNNHEYKNQLAVIRNMANGNKKIINYIDEILKDQVYVEDFWVNEIKYLPSGGIKGLLYYKLLLTKKENIDICLSVSRDVSKYVDDIDSMELKNISRVLGIYLDNSIEAAKECDNKVIAIEIYSKGSKLMIVISNTYKGEINLNRINKKGYTTKGKGHGNGLYFAQKIIKKSSILESDNSLINNYYVQKLIIGNKNDS